MSAPPPRRLGSPQFPENGTFWDILGHPYTSARLAARPGQPARCAAATYGAASPGQPATKVRLTIFAVCPRVTCAYGRK